MTSSLNMLLLLCILSTGNDIVGSSQFRTTEKESDGFTKTDPSFPVYMLSICLMLCDIDSADAGFAI
jgi:hypothetical protein